MANLKALFAVVLCIVFASALRIREEEYCYSEDNERPQNLHMATKTAYQLIKGTDQIKIPPGCVPEKIWILSRHGTRLPTPSHIDKMKDKLPKLKKDILKNHRNGQGFLCEEDLKLFEKWSWNTTITTDIGDFLTQQGWEDLKGIAEVYKQIFPTLFPGQYSPEQFLFRHTDTERTEHSYFAFVDGLFGDGANKRIPVPDLPTRDTLLRPYDYCPAWAEQKAAIDDEDSEVSKFKSSEWYKEVLKDVSRKIGYGEKDKLESKYLETMVEMCSFEIAWDIGTSSPWCAPFVLEHIKVLEYAEDMKDWYKSGSSSELNSRLSCELLQDIYGKITNSSGPSVIAYIAHDTTVQLLLTSLGIAAQDKDLPLLADNYDKQSNRPWMTSKITPFATNLSFVRMNCTGEIKFHILMNQRLLNVSWCPEGLCDLHSLENRFKDISTVSCNTFFCPPKQEIKVTLISH